MKLERKTRFSKIGAPVTVFIGDYQKVSLYNKENITVDLLEEETFLSIKHSRQAKKRVTNDQNLVITDNPLHLLLFWSGVTLIIVSQLLLSFDSQLLYFLTVFGFASILCSFFIPKFKWVTL
ncbi:hypothetical protein ACVRWQ_00445 [Streptococcus phocae subsp. salmonis]|uniref:hypothetical protein n=1 Tax=Streptococcus phocae TaxID=119224 RepID=UPI000531632D|nr:hypothetical protein [Streptococcus phocae]KGR72993.1 membrane protein [Streptococcus phocae subsp. salmonis]